MDTLLARRIQTTYLGLLFGNTLAASLIWGINTLFLLQAGLSNFEAFAANAFFSLGMVVFEIPTGIVADSWSRKASYLLGTITLALTTVAYYCMWLWHAPFVGWAIASFFIGLGFTFFSGAIEAWLVDALAYAGYTSSLDAIFGKGQTVSGAAMLAGSLGGGFLAAHTTIGIPFLVRAGILVLLFIAATMYMKDWGFTPERHKSMRNALRTLSAASVTYGLRNPPVRWLMASSIFLSSVGFYVFYALQPYLLELYGDPKAYSVAGIVAALVACSQMVGGITAGKVAGLVQRRTTILLVMTVLSCAVLIGLGVTHNFYVAFCLIALWSTTFAAVTPVRQAYINGMIPSKQRATILSFDSLVGDIGSSTVQPALGKAADVYSYGTSLLMGGVFQLLTVPFLLASRHHSHPADITKIKTK